MLLKHQQIDAGAVQQISCQFHTRSNSEHQETSSVPLELQVFNHHNGFTSSFGILKVLFFTENRLTGSGVDYLRHREKSCIILPKCYWQKEKKRFIDVEVVVYGIGFPWEKFRRNRSGEHSDASNCLWCFPSTRAQQATKPDCLRKVRTCKQKIICQTPEKWGASLHSNLLPVAKKTYDENRFYFLLKVWDPWTYGHFCAGKRWIIMYSCGQLLFCQLLLKTGVGDHCNFCKCVQISTWTFCSFKIHSDQHIKHMRADPSFIREI